MIEVKPHGQTLGEARGMQQKRPPVVNSQNGRPPELGVKTRTRFL